MSNWHTLYLEGILVPGHNTPSFVRKRKANFISGANLIWADNIPIVTSECAAFEKKRILSHQWTLTTHLC